MSLPPPRKVLIAGGKAGGGVAAFAEGLRSGFSELGIPAEVAPANNVLRRIRELRDVEVLKILSLSAVFAAPIARRAICVAHGFPCIAHVGRIRSSAILASLRIAVASPNARLVAVSHYTAVHLRVVFGIPVEGVIHNPLCPIFLESPPHGQQERIAISFVGRLVEAKNPQLLLPAMIDMLGENPRMQAWIIGDGPLRPQLERIADAHPRLEFLGALTPIKVRDRLRRSRVFVSGSPTEPFGITYLEALSQGCAVAMPASGGGLEIAPERIGKDVHLLSSSMTREGIADALRKALKTAPYEVPFVSRSPLAVASDYLQFSAGSADSRLLFHPREGKTYSGRPGANR